MNPPTELAPLWPWDGGPESKPAPNRWLPPRVFLDVLDGFDKSCHLDGDYSVLLPTSLVRGRPLQSEEVIHACTD